MLECRALSNHSAEKVQLGHTFHLAFQSGYRNKHLAFPAPHFRWYFRSRKRRQNHCGCKSGNTVDKPIAGRRIALSAIAVRNPGGIDLSTRGCRTRPAEYSLSLPGWSFLASNLRTHQHSYIRYRAVEVFRTWKFSFHQGQRKINTVLTSSKETFGR